MFITEEVNLATVAYFKKIVLRKLFMEFSFGLQSNNRVITDLFENVNYYGFDLPYDIELALLERLQQFKNNLDKEELTALFFWCVNRKYICYLENFLGDCDNYSEQKFDEEFGRSLAYKIYEPCASGLEEDTIDELQLLLCNFASEFDLSLVDEYTCQEILEVMEIYCSAIH